MGRRLPVGRPLGIAGAREEGRCRSQRTMVWVGLTHRHELTRWHVPKAPAKHHPHPHTPCYLLQVLFTDGNFATFTSSRCVTGAQGWHGCCLTRGLLILSDRCHATAAPPHALCTWSVLLPLPKTILARHPSLRSNAFPTSASTPGQNRAGLHPAALLPRLAGVGAPPRGPGGGGGGGGRPWWRLHHAAKAGIARTLVAVVSIWPCAHLQRGATTFVAPPATALRFFAGHDSCVLLQELALRSCPVSWSLRPPSCMAVCVCRQSVVTLLNLFHAAWP